MKVRFRRTEERSEGKKGDLGERGERSVEREAAVRKAAGDHQTGGRDQRIVECLDFRAGLVAEV
jgi:hypothetical protein